MIFAAGAAWGIVTYKIRRVESDQADLKTTSETIQQSIAALGNTIREEFDRAIGRINNLVFEDSGTSRYLPRVEYERQHDGCRADLIRRIENLERKAGIG
jgi:hypothetical protein